MQDNAVIPFFFCDEQVRTVTLDDGVWFVVSDVCNILGLKNGGNNARRSLNEERTRYYPISSSFIRGGKTVNTTVKMLLTDESGVYRLVLRSYKPDAMKFQHWITSEVLPSLRESGGYEMLAQKAADEMRTEELSLDSIAVYSEELVITCSRKNNTMRLEIPVTLRGHAFMGDVRAILSDYVKQ